MDLLNEARVQLESVVGEDLLKEYFAILRQWFLFNSPINKDEFDRQARKLLLNEEQVIAHNRFLRALLDKTSSDTTKLSKSIESAETSKPKNSSSKVVSESVNSESSKETLHRGSFHPVDFINYVPTVSGSSLPQNAESMRSAASELFMPDHSLVSTRIIIVAWENGMQGVEANVTDVILSSCQMFVKNILTAMISRKKGYKVRDGKFQYGFNQPIPDPFLRNYSNVIDDTMESRVEVSETDDSFVPRCKSSLESTEHQISFAYSSAKRKRTDNMLTVKLLYDTLKENASLLGRDAKHELHLLKLSLQIDS